MAAAGLHLPDQARQRIGIGLAIGAPQRQPLPAEPGVDLQRLGAEGAFAQAAGALHHVQMPAGAQVAAQRVHLLATADEARLQHPGAAAGIGCLGAPLGGLRHNARAACDLRAERMVRAALIQHHLRPGVGQVAARRPAARVARPAASNDRLRLRHGRTREAHRVARSPPLRQRGVEAALRPRREFVQHRPEIPHHLRDAVAVQGGGDGAQPAGLAGGRRVAAVATGEVEEMRQPARGVAADFGQQIIDRDRIALAEFVFELQEPGAAMAGKVHTDRWWVAAAQSLDQVRDLAHLIDHYAQVLVQRADDEERLPLVVEPAAFRRGDGHQQADRRRRRCQHRRKRRRHAARHVQPAVPQSEALLQPQQLPRQAQNLLVLALDHQQRRRRVAAGRVCQEGRFVVRERLREGVPDPDGGGIEAVRVLPGLDRNARQAPERIERGGDRGVAVRSGDRALRRLAGGAVRADGPLRSGGAGRGDGQGQCRQQHRTGEVGRAQTAALQGFDQIVREFVGADQDNGQVVVACDDRVAGCVLADRDVALVHRDAALQGEADQRQQLVPIVAQPGDHALHVGDDLLALVAEIRRLGGIVQRALQRLADLVLVGVHPAGIVRRLGQRVGDLLPLAGVQAGEKLRQRADLRTDIDAGGGRENGPLIADLRRVLVAGHDGAARDIAADCYVALAHRPISTGGVPLAWARVGRSIQSCHRLVHHARNCPALQFGHLGGLGRKFRSKAARDRVGRISARQPSPASPTPDNGNYQAYNGRKVLTAPFWRCPNREKTADLPALAEPLVTRPACVAKLCETVSLRERRAGHVKRKSPGSIPGSSECRRLASYRSVHQQ